MVGAYFKQRMEELAARHDTIGDVRGLGLMVATEIVKSKAGKERNPELRNKLENAAFERGLLMLGCGENTIRFCPPLVVSKAEVDKCIEIYDEALKGTK